MKFVRLANSKIRHFQVSSIPGGGLYFCRYNLSLPVVYGVFPLAIKKINYMSKHTQGNPGFFFSWRAQSFASYRERIQGCQLPTSSKLILRIDGEEMIDDVIMHGT